MFLHFCAIRACSLVGKGNAKNIFSCIYYLNLFKLKQYKQKILLIFQRYQYAVRLLIDAICSS